jgi:hypothetical protein
MKELLFRLEPFATVPPLHPNVQITGTIAHASNSLTVEYLVSGEVDRLFFSGAGETPTRRHRLWEATCLELFVAPQDSPHYWEFNFTPAGHWNVYSFQSYREGMREEKAYHSFPFTAHREEERLVIELMLDLQPLVRQEQALEVAISAVSKEAGAEPIYWALTHRAPMPDFHRRDSFILRFPTESHSR